MAPINRKSPSQWGATPPYRDAPERKGKGKYHGRTGLPPRFYILFLWGIPSLFAIIFTLRWSRYFSQIYYENGNTMAMWLNSALSIDESKPSNPVSKPFSKARTEMAVQVGFNSSQRSRREAQSLILSDPPPLRAPTHKACNGYAGIYHIKSGDVGGAAGTIFFQFVIAQLIYCEMYNLKPWIHMDLTSLHVVDYNVHFYNKDENRVSRSQFSMMKGMTIPYLEDYRHPEARYPGPPQLMSPPLHPHSFSVTGDGVWEHYFEPASDFVPGDESCEIKPLLTMDLFLITPGLHIYAPWTPRIWRYSILPDYLLGRHLKSREWLEPQRLEGNRITQKYIHPRQELWDAANRVNPSPAGKSSNTTTDCLGLHVRWTDKEGGRRLIQVDEFLPYVEAYVNNGGTCVFVATDSGKVLRHIHKTWPAEIRRMLRSQGDHIIRSDDSVPVFQKGATSHHRTNIEVLVDILALAKCRFMLHGLSAVTDSAMYLNYALIYQSVDLEDEHKLSPGDFGVMVKDVLREKGLNRTRFFPKGWWETDDNVTSEVMIPTHHACDGYSGILHIEYAGVEASTGMAFFHYILNQLYYAERNNLKPWVFLSNASHAIYDIETHGCGEGETFNMMDGMQASIVRDQQRPESLYPGELDEESKLRKNSFHVSGNGVWKNYLDPVSDFVPGDKSCRDKPLVRLEHRLVEPGLRVWAPWSVRSREYDDLPAHRGKPFHGNYSNWYEPMRRRAHELVKKYFHFRPSIWRRVEEVMPINVTETPCLAAHLPFNQDVYAEYLRSFVTAGGKCIYVATASWHVVDWLESLPRSITDKMIWQGEHVVRSVRELPIQHMEGRHHRINSEAFVDVLAMSKCEFLLHQSTTISEAAIYFNLNLHNRSVNVDDPNRLSVTEFEALVRLYLATHQARSDKSLI